MLLVTFHETIANIYGYDETKPNSAPLVNLIETSSGLSELRGILLANGSLYVVNGGKTVSNVLCCAPDPQKQYYYRQQSVFMPAGSVVNHPFALAFESPGSGSNPTQTWYVSDQDSNVVATFTSQSPYTSTVAGSSVYLTALLTALQKSGSPLDSPGFLTATFVPTAVVGAEIPAQTTVDPTWGGLMPVFSPPDSPEDQKSAGGKKSKQKVQNSVRGLAISDGVLYVADEGGNAVRMYDTATGVPLGVASLDGPVHLLVQGGKLYVTSGNSIYYGTCVSPPATPPALPVSNQFSKGAPPPWPSPPSGYTNSVTLSVADLNLDLPSGAGPSGFTFDTSGNLYVALRKLSQIYAFSPNSNGGFTPSSSNPIFTVGDEPEFLVWIENPS